MTSHDPHLPGDPELAALLPVIVGPAGQFRHRQHIHLAFAAVRRYGMPAAAGKVRVGTPSLASLSAPRVHRSVSARVRISAGDVG